MNWMDISSHPLIKAFYLLKIFRYEHEVSSSLCMRLICKLREKDFLRLLSVNEIGERSLQDIINKSYYIDDHMILSQEVCLYKRD